MVDGYFRWVLPGVWASMRVTRMKTEDQGRKVQTSQGFPPGGVNPCNAKLGCLLYSILFLIRTNPTRASKGLTVSYSQGRRGTTRFPLRSFTCFFQFSRYTFVFPPYIVFPLLKYLRETAFNKGSLRSDLPRHTTCLTCWSCYCFLQTDLSKKLRSPLK